MEKSSLSELIKAARKQKGLTQQELADSSSLSLRTIQRIEKGTKEASTYSLKQISKILDLTFNEITKLQMNQIKKDDNQRGSINVLYLSSLTFILNPLFGLIVPGIIGFSKQNKSEAYKQQLKKILLIQGIPLAIFFILLTQFFLTITFDIPIPKYLDAEGMELFLIPIVYYLVVITLLVINYRQLNKQLKTIA